MACNESPPKINFDFECSQVEKKTVYLTLLGTPCQYMHLLPKDAFITPSDSEETELSSDESIASNDSSVKIISIPSTSCTAGKKVKEEKLSDTEDTSKSKGSKKSSPKSRKWRGVEYPTSDDSGDDKNKSHRAKHSNESEENQSKARCKKECSSKSIKKEDFEDEEQKYTPGLSAAFGNFHCQVCDIVVNSEVTYQTHLQGKKHQKALKAKAIPEVAMQSLNEPRLPPPLVGVSNASLRRDRRIPLRVESLIQLVAESYSEGPLPGLSEVVEVRPASEEAKEIAYLCNLCEAQCVPNSIMKHLTGFKHYLRCLETIDTISYEKYRFSPKKVIEGRVRRILLDYERRRGRGIIRVEQEVDDLCSMSGEPGPSWKNIGSVPSTAASADGFDDSEFVSAMEHLDTSMSDFHCRACDAHMNNKAMWESHVRGKRHLKNVKKVPGENTSKVKSYHCPEETAHLMSLLELEGVDEYNEPYLIVGLDFIKETQNEAGDLYNCFLCGACTSSYDIIEHLIQPKHKVKYLETLNARGCENFIENIKSLSDVSARSKECMIDEECRNALQKYGEGKVAVYRSKNIYASSSYAGSHSSRY